jgi:fatty acid desaturase
MEDSLARGNGKITSHPPKLYGVIFMSNKQKKEFSKILTVAISAFYFGIILFSLIFWAFTNRIPEVILTTIAVPFSSVTAFYFIKAGYENGKKIGSNSTPTI